MLNLNRIFWDAFPRLNHMHCAHVGRKMGCWWGWLSACTQVSASRHMLSPKHARKPFRCKQIMNTVSSQRFSFSSRLEWYFCSCQEPVNHSTPCPLSILTSSLSVVNADMLHLEALPYMCCIDISLLTFPFPGGLIVTLPVMMWKKETWDFCLTVLG